MRAAAILGLGSSEKDLKPFQKAPGISWSLGVPAEPQSTDVLLIFGGDGTIHRHLAKLVRMRRPVLVVPCGSGNDFARALGLRSVRDAQAAWEKFSSGGANVRTIDLGLITPVSDATAAVPAHQHYFCSVGGAGLDSEVARRANRFPRWLRGHGGYALALPVALLQSRPSQTKLSVASDGDPGALVGHGEKLLFLAAFANATAYGGGMKIAPRAQLDDGKLDICLISDINKLKLFCLFPTVYFGGHLKMPGVEYFQTSRLRLEPERPLDVYADGEYVCPTPIEVSVARSALQVVIP